MYIPIHPQKGLYAVTEIYAVDVYYFCGQYNKVKCSLHDKKKITSPVNICDKELPLLINI